jgi:hypothetical protein
VLCPGAILFTIPSFFSWKVDSIQITFLWSEINPFRDKSGSVVLGSHPGSPGFTPFGWLLPPSGLAATVSLIIAKKKMSLTAYRLKDDTENKFNKNFKNESKKFVTYFFFIWLVI